MIHLHYLNDDGEMDEELARVSIEWAKRRDTVKDIVINVDVPAVDASLSQLYKPLSRCSVETASIRMPGIVGCLMNPTSAWFWFEDEPTIPIKGLPRGDKLQLTRRLIMLNDQGKKNTLREMIMENGGKIPLTFIQPRWTRSTEFYNSEEMKEIRAKSREKMKAIRESADKVHVPVSNKTIISSKPTGLTSKPSDRTIQTSPSPAEQGMRSGKDTMWTALLRTKREK
jgi:hypothetical protein